MAYKDRFGITDICTKEYNNLSISWDCDGDREDPKQRYPVLLFTPSMNNTDTHYHIQLDKKEAQKLAKWLQDHLANKKTRWRK